MTDIRKPKSQTDVTTAIVKINPNAIRLPELKPGMVVKMPLKFIRPNPDNPRKIFKKDDIDSLAKTLKSKGDVEEPVQLIVRGNGTYTILRSGERRFRAATQACLETISAYIRAPESDKELFISSARINFGHQPMNVVENAYVAKRFIHDYGWSREQTAEEMGVGVGTIDNLMKIFRLRKEIHAMILKGDFDVMAGYALGSYDMKDQIELANAAQAEMKRLGRAISYSEAIKIFRKEAERRGIIPVKTKKGKRHMSHAQLVMRNVTRRSELLRLDMEELLGIEDKIIETQGGATTMPLTGELRAVHEVMGKAYAMIDKLIKRLAPLA